MVELIRMKKTIVSLGLIFYMLILFSSAALAAHDQNEATVNIMSQNMDSGTDLGFVLALGGTAESVDLTLAEIMASNIPERADLLAAQIAAEQPQIVALQEVTLWRTGPTPETATQTLYDQLELLLAALVNHGVAYDVVAINRLTDLALPGSSGALRYTDRDVLLVRSDLRPPAFLFSDVHARLYNAAFTFQGLTVSQGWISADVHMGRKQFRMVMTHLETPIPGIPEATDVQVAQADELVHVLRNLTIPVVACGDFNSDANFGNGPDATPSVALIEAAGYADTWRIANPSDPGNTWPLFLEDQYPPPFFVPYTPFERIDLFFSRGIDIIGAHQVLAPASGGSVPPYGSDHAGVIAMFEP
jgi:endonuclease/exonuclease/phosphatase family metal-dependent hydrolase